MKAFASILVLIMVVEMFPRPSSFGHSGDISMQNANSMKAMLKIQAERQALSELAIWDVRIYELAKRTEAPGSKLLERQWKKGIAQIIRERDTFKNRMNELQSATSDTWSNTSSALETAKSNLADSYSTLIERLGWSLKPPFRIKSEVITLDVTAPVRPRKITQRLYDPKINSHQP